MLNFFSFFFFFFFFFLPVHKWNNPSKRQVDGSLAKTMLGNSTQNWLSTIAVRIITSSYLEIDLD